MYVIFFVRFSTNRFVCKIPLLARALGLSARDDRVSCIQLIDSYYRIGLEYIMFVFSDFEFIYLYLMFIVLNK